MTSIPWSRAPVHTLFAVRPPAPRKWPLAGRIAFIAGLSIALWAAIIAAICL